jgi:hypothetical protein
MTRTVRLDAGLLACWRAGALQTVVARPWSFDEIYMAISTADPAVRAMRDGAELTLEFPLRPLLPWMVPRRFLLAASAPRMVPPIPAPKVAAPVILPAPGRIPGTLPGGFCLSLLRRREAVTV